VIFLKRSLDFRKKNALINYQLIYENGDFSLLDELDRTFECRKEMVYMRLFKEETLEEIEKINKRTGLVDEFLKYLKM